MGLDVTVMIADWAWLGEVPPRKRLSRLRDAWYADETGLWDHDAPVVEGDWEWPRGPHSAVFAVYEFRGTLGSFKPHFWAGEQWASVRDHADPLVRTALDTLLLGLVWGGPDYTEEQVEPVRPPAPGQDRRGVRHPAEPPDELRLGLRPVDVDH